MGSYCRMPPKADYWKYFTVQGLLALCQIEGCPKPTVSLGLAPKNGGKKRITTGGVTGHLEKHHAEEWGAYCEIRKRTKAEVAAVKKEEVGTKISDDEQGVKTFKKDLLASIERRLGEVERLDHFALATALDPRCWSFSELHWVILLTCAGTFSPVFQSLKTG